MNDRAVSNPGRTAAAGAPHVPDHLPAVAEPPGLVPSPYDAPELYDLMFESLEFDMPFWLELGRSAGGPVLEVGCGTGRVLLRLRAAGIDADGVDLSNSMLVQLRDKAAAGGLAVHVVQGDMRRFTMPRRYARAICAFNAFAHCETMEDQLQALRCIHAQLEDGGALVLHMSYPSVSLWTDPSGEPVLELESKHPLNGNTLQLWDTRFKYVVDQFQRSQVEVREIDPQGVVVQSQCFETTQRWVYPYELELLLRLSGYSRTEIFGGFEREPLERDDQQMVAWAWK